ncbi:restriction endonuclease subunit S [Bacillus vallismortis]|uniref:restriction endonuclease subunit S n=1 Tax=Bacillus vallismortis TaxID=72361 RepID=UPI003B97E41C
MVNKRVPEVRFEGFSGEWEERSFQDFTKLSQGLQIAIDKRHLVPGKNRMFYITNEFLNPNSDKRYYIESPSKSVIAKEEDILMTRTGNTGKVVTNVEGAFHNNFFRIAYNNKETAKLFLYYLLNSSPIQKEILVRAGTSTIPDLNHNDFYKIKVNTPQYEEQTQVGNFFNQLDDTIALHQQELTTLKQTKQGFLQKMFPKEGESVPEVRFPGFSGEWGQHKLGDIGQTFTGLSGKSKGDFGHGSAEFVTYMNVFSNIISDISLTENVEIDSKQNELKYGDVLFTTSSETPQEVGMSSVWLDNRKNVYLNSFCFGYRPTVNINYLFLAYLLRSNVVRKQIMLLAQGISRYNISKSKVMELVVLLPDIKEQTKIGTFFKQLDDSIALHQRELDALKETKKAFLQKMFV